MSPITYGSHKLGDVSGLPNVQVAFPGEHWSDGKASEDITPGELIVPVASGGKRVWARATAGNLDPRACIALNPVQHPDSNAGSIYNEGLGPNQIVNRTLKAGQWVHAYKSGAFNLTLIEAHAYVPGDLLTFDPAATPQPGKTSTGAWKKTTTIAQALFEVTLFRPIPDHADRGVATVQSLRSQF